MSASELISSSRFPLADADLCVKCGMCLPHCPTYLDTRHEGDSPRGRIAIMQGLASGKLQPTRSLQEHLDGCLACRACETVCPAEVPYGELIDAGRAELLRRQPKRDRFSRLVAAVFTRPRLRRLLAWPLRVYQGIGAQWLVRRLRLLGRGRLARLESLLPRLAGRAPQTSTPTCDVALFAGCMGDTFDARTVKDAHALMGRLGIKVDLPKEQTCCGALHQHAGREEPARELARRNAEVFDGYSAVLTCASGCGASLKEYDRILGGDAGAAMAGKVQDLSAFLHERWPAGTTLNPLSARVAVHTPCTLRNVLRTPGAVSRLLHRIPGVEVVELDPAQHCCGAAGSYFLTQPAMADRLLQRKLDAARDLQPDFIVSGNIGCNLHLAGGLRRAGLAGEVLHPVSLLARQMPEVG